MPPQGTQRAFTGHVSHVVCVSMDDVFTILTVRQSFCVRRNMAQRLVDALGRREETVTIDAMAPDGSTVASVLLHARDVIQIIEHRFLKNDLLESWWSHTEKVVDISEYRQAVGG